MVLAIVYGILGATGTVTALTPDEVCRGILTVTVLALTVGGMTAIYQMEKLPLISAIAIHGDVLYAVYILIYLFNGWLKHQLTAVLVFTGIFMVGYALIWLVIYLGIRSNTNALNRKLHQAL